MTKHELRGRALIIWGCLVQNEKKKNILPLFKNYSRGLQKNYCQAIRQGVHQEEMKKKLRPFSRNFFSFGICVKTLITLSRKYSHLNIDSFVEVCKLVSKRSNLRSLATSLGECIRLLPPKELVSMFIHSRIGFFLRVQNICVQDYSALIRGVLRGHP